MNTLTDLEYILSEGRIDNEYLPRAWHQGTAEESRHHEDDTNIEYNQVGRVAGKEARHHFLLERNETKSITREDIVLKGFDLPCISGVVSEHLLQRPVVVGHVVLSRIAVVSKRVVCGHCWICGLDRVGCLLLICLLSDDDVRWEQRGKTRLCAGDLIS